MINLIVMIVLSIVLNINYIGVRIMIDGDKLLKEVMYGIYYVETGREKGIDPYKVIGPMTKVGYAIGKYQIMSSNVKDWTMKALGYAMSAEQFKNSPEAQEKTAAFIIGSYLKQYSPEDTASMWFSGRPIKKAGNAKDAFGTSVPVYVRVFNVGRELFRKSIAE